MIPLMANSFKEEYIELLQKYGVDYDERYLWGGLKK